MDTPHPRKLCLRCFNGSETIGVKNILVALETAYGNNVFGKFFITKVFDVVANFVAQLSQPARDSIVDNVRGHSVAPGRVSMSGRQVDAHGKVGESA